MIAIEHELSELDINYNSQPLLHVINTRNKVRRFIYTHSRVHITHDHVGV